MENEPDTFVQLQKHLDAQAVGFPATKKKSEIRLLQLIFKPNQAKIALNLSYHYEPVGAILSRMQASGKITMTREELEKILDQMGKDRAIMRRIRNGEKEYAIVPFVVGMFELQLGQLNKEFVTTMNEYTTNTNFALSFIGTEYSQMRTIPIEQSITPEHHITNYNDLKALIMRSPEPFVINKCICREKQNIQGNSCKVTKRTEVCLAMGDMGQACADVGLGRVISKDEALEIERLNEEDGLVLQPSGAQEIQFNVHVVAAVVGCLTSSIKSLAPRTSGPRIIIR